MARRRAASVDIGDFPRENEKVHVSIDNLNIRTGPGTDCMPTGNLTGRGDFEISERAEGKGSLKGWGKLADGRGWISLDFVD